jgi:hypothetical protein
MIPDVPGRMETVMGVAARLPEFDPDERAFVVMGMITCAMFLEGPHSQSAADIQRQYGGMLYRDAQQMLKKIERELIAEPYQPDDDGPSVYDLCCEGFSAAGDDAPFVREEPKLGRNEPCWCGSGKKYKKCHLAADEAR